MKALIPSSLALLLVTVSAQSETIRVPVDHPSIQAAIDAAKGGDRIEVAAGTYRERVRMKPGLHLVSAGDNTEGKLGLLRAERTIIDGHGKKDGPGVAMAEHALLDGFTVRNVGTYDDALWKKHWEERGENQKHEHIGAFGAPGIGIDGISCRVLNCIVHHNGHTGIALRGKEGETVDPIVTTNICYRNMGGGIGIMNGASGIVRDNHCFENLYAGIGHSVGATPLVAKNVCYNNVRAGIGVSEGSSPIVRDNDCHHNRRAGIGIRSGAQTRPVIEQNHCHQNGMAGIGTEDHAEPIIRNNLCEKNEMAGIGARLGAKPLIVGNKSRLNAAAGIGMQSDCEAILWKNHCENNKLVAIGLPSKARALIVDNVLSREGGMPPLIAIRGGSQAVLHRNKLDGGGIASVLLEGTAILSENTITGRNAKFGQGVWLWKGSRALAHGNTVGGFKTAVSVSEGASWLGEKP